MDGDSADAGALCAALANSRFEALSSGECGSGQDGASYGCQWILEFDHDNIVRWRHSDVIEVFAYTCEGGAIATSSVSRRTIYTGHYDRIADEVIWDGRSIQSCSVVRVVFVSTVHNESVDRTLVGSSGTKCSDAAPPTSLSPPVRSWRCKGRQHLAINDAFFPVLSWARVGRAW